MSVHFISLQAETVRLISQLVISQATEIMTDDCDCVLQPLQPLCVRFWVPNVHSS